MLLMTRQELTRMLHQVSVISLVVLQLLPSCGNVYISANGLSKRQLLGNITTVRGYPRWWSTVT